MNKEKLINSYKNMNIKQETEVVDEMIDNILYYRDIEGIVYAEIEIETGDINVSFVANTNGIPCFDKSICISSYTTGHLEEALPSSSDLPDKIRYAEDDVAEYFKAYGLDIIEFISLNEFEEQLEQRVGKQLDEEIKTQPQKLRVGHLLPQIGYGFEFCVPVESPEEGYKVIQILAAYDMYQYENKIKPNYCNVSGLEYYDTEDGEWYDWHDEFGRDIDEYAKEHGLNCDDIWSNCK